LRALAFLLPAVCAGITPAAGLPAGFVHVDEVIPNITLEIRYCTDDNYTGRRVMGYEQPPIGNGSTSA
jgi:D-alanyl-D-alanine dipeptidase